MAEVKANDPRRPMPRIKIVEDGKFKTLQLRLTRIANGWLVKPGAGTFYAPDLDAVRVMVNECLDQLDTKDVEGHFEWKEKENVE